MNKELTLDEIQISRDKEFKNWKVAHNKYLIYMYYNIIPLYVKVNISFERFCIFTYVNSSGYVSQYL